MMSPDSELTRELKEKLDGVKETFEKGKKLFSEIKAETEAKLHEMGKEKSATAEAQDATAKPDPPTSSS